MDQRVAVLEADVKDVKATLGRMEVTLGRMEERLEHLATKADLALNTGALNTLSTNVTAIDDRVGKVERAVDDTMKAALGKAIGPWQLPGILAACIAVVAAGIAIVGWIVSRPWFLH